MAGGLEFLSNLSLELVLGQLRLKDLAALAASSKGMQALVSRQPESIWRAAAAVDEAYERYLQHVQPQAQACRLSQASTCAAGTLCTGRQASRELFLAGM